MKINNLGLLLFFLSSCVSAQSLCGVNLAAKGSGDSNDYNFSLDGKVDSRITLSHDKGETDYDLKAGILSIAGKKSTSIKAPIGANAYVIQGPDKSCVIRFEEQNGISGIYIEEHILSKGKPPQIRTEFVEVR